MSFRQTGTINILFTAALALFFFTLSSNKTLAQSSGSRPSPIDRRVEEMNRQREQYDRDTLRDGLDRKSQRPADQKAAREITLQVKQDFEHIQSVYNQIVLVMTANSALDYKFIYDATGEVKKSASRLKRNLALPEPEPDEASAKKEADLTQEAIKPSLLKLCSHIVSFVTNPLFETSGVLDVEQSIKASKDLEKVIELSDGIWRSAGKLK
jgi:hypothetical protein